MASGDLLESRRRSDERVGGPQPRLQPKGPAVGACRARAMTRAVLPGRTRLTTARSSVPQSGWPGHGCARCKAADVRPSSRSACSRSQVSCLRAPGLRELMSARPPLGIGQSSDSEVPAGFASHCPQGIDGRQGRDLQRQHPANERGILRWLSATRRGTLAVEFTCRTAFDSPRSRLRRVIDALGLPVPACADQPLT